MSEQPTLDFDAAAGQAAKRAGLDQVEGSHPDFVPRLRAAVKAYAIEHGTVTADDARKIAGALGLRPRHKNAWGAVFRGRCWVRAGDCSSELVSNHGHRNPVWRYDPSRDAEDDP